MDNQERIDRLNSALDILFAGFEFKEEIREKCAEILSMYLKVYEQTRVLKLVSSKNENRINAILFLAMIASLMMMYLLTGQPIMRYFIDTSKVSVSWFTKLICYQMLTILIVLQIGSAFAVLLLKEQLEKYFPRYHDEIRVGEAELRELLA